MLKSIAVLQRRLHSWFFLYFSPLLLRGTNYAKYTHFFGNTMKRNEHTYLYSSHYGWQRNGILLYLKTEMMRGTRNQTKSLNLDAKKWNQNQRVWSINYDFFVINPDINQIMIILNYIWCSFKSNQIQLIALKPRITSISMYRVPTLNGLMCEKVSK